MSTETNGTPTSTAKPLTIAVIAEEVQLVDVVGIDCLNNCSTQWCTDGESLGTGPLIPHTSPMNIIWPSSTLKPAKMTGGIKFQPTCTYDDCPRDLDILLIGGPHLSHRPEGATKLMKESWARTKVVMTTCTGSLWLADSGVLKGHRATTNRGALGIAKERNPDVNWEYARWVVDKKEGGELWTAGGAQAGIDMIATYVRQNFPPQLSGFALEAIDVDETARGIAYKEAKTVFI